MSELEISTEDSEGQRDGETFLFRVSDPEGFDDAARARLKPIVEHVCDRLDVVLLGYEASEETVTLSLENHTSTSLPRLISTVQTRIQSRYGQELDQAKRAGDAPKEAIPVMWGGRIYLGSDGADYRADGPPDVPSDEELDQTPNDELRQLAMSHGANGNQQRQDIIEELRDVRTEGATSIRERIAEMADRATDRTDFSLKVRH